MPTTRLKGKVALVQIKGVNGNPDTLMVEVTLDNNQILTILDNPDQNVRISNNIREKAQELIDVVVQEAHK